MADSQPNGNSHIPPVSSTSYRLPTIKNAVRITRWACGWLAIGLSMLIFRCSFAQTAGSQGDPILPQGAVARFGAAQDGQQSRGIRQLRFSPDGSLLAGSDQSQRIHVWEIPSGTLRYTIESRAEKRVVFTFSPDGNYLVTGSMAATEPVQIWDAKTGSPRFKIAGPAWQLRYCHDGRLAVVTPARITFYRTSDAKPTRMQSPPLLPRTQFLSLSPNGKELLMFSASQQHALLLRDLTTGQRRAFRSFHELLKFAVFRPDGQEIAVGTWPGENPSFRVTLFDLQQAGSIRYLEGHEDIVEDLTFSQDQRFVATASWDGTARIWELLTGKTIRSLHATQVPNLLLNVDEQLLRKRTRVHRRGWPTSHVTAVSLSDDGRWLATGADGDCDNKVVLWPFDKLILANPDVDQHESSQPDALEPVMSESVNASAELWQKLASEDPRVAYSAVASALSRPAALTYFTERLKATVSVVPAEKVDRLIRHLDHDDFGVREMAFRQLAPLRAVAERQLQAALVGSTSLEQRLSIERILSQDQLEEPIPPTERRRLHRLVFLYEQMGGQLGRELLSTVAASHPNRSVTTEVRSALQRLRTPGLSGK